MHFLGYIYSPDILQSLRDFVKKLKAVSCPMNETADLQRFLGISTQNCFYFMDPVMGDNGSLYVPVEMVAKYVEAMAIADVITPNEFELQWLANPGVTDLSHCIDKEFTIENILQLIGTCHARGPACVFLTSCRLSGVNDSKLVSMASLRTPGEEPLLVLSIFDKFDGFVGGCGDITASLFVDRLLRVAATYRHDDRNHLFMTAVRETLNTVQVMSNSKCRYFCSIF